MKKRPCFMMLNAATTVKRITVREKTRHQIAPQPEGAWVGDTETRETIGE